MLSERAAMSRPKPANLQQGVVLLETLVAILIFSVGVLAIVGLQAAMVKNVAEAKFRSEASYIAQARVGQIWADPANAATYVETDTDISTLLPSGKRTVTQPSAGEFVVTVTWQQPGPNQPVRNFTTNVRVTGG
jgi:type IV pilus assembly protein PilV